MNPSTSLFIDRYSPEHVAFYINGDLQFDSQDEAIYHQYLVGPAIALAEQNHTKPLRVLICGGGDGLAARDVLRFPSVGAVTLVDYDPEVLELARTVFAPYNEGSLGDGSVTVQTREAFEFVRSLPSASFDVIICDFTFPSCPETEKMHTREWFKELNRLLGDRGALATNGVSPDHNNAAFWCLYQTLLSAAFDTKPLRVEIPSFRRHAYGGWGFFLSAKIPLVDLQTLQFPAALNHLDRDWLNCFQFPERLVHDRHQACIHTLDRPYLLYALLNNPPITVQNPSICVDFLTLREECTGVVSDRNPFTPAHLTQTWLNQLGDMHPENLLVQHPAMTPMMVQSWLSHAPQMLEQIDIPKLIRYLKEQPQNLPRKLLQSLSQDAFADRIEELEIALKAVMITANLAVPDTVYSKGSGGDRPRSSGSSSGGNGNGNDNISVLVALLLLGGTAFLVAVIASALSNAGGK
jgi:spermidine synthase